MSSHRSTHVRSEILLAVLLVVGQTPLPWRHNHTALSDGHTDLSDADLARHVKRFHLPVGQTAPPAERHWHISPPEQIALRIEIGESGLPGLCRSDCVTGRSVFPPDEFSPHCSSGVRGQQTSLRLKMLLIETAA